MEVTYDSSLNARQEQWISAAIGLCRYPLEDLDVDVTFESVPEPSAAGHKDAMCTTGAGGEYLVEVRAGLEDPNSPINEGKQETVKDFFREAVVHEIGHVVEKEYLRYRADYYAEFGDTEEGARFNQLVKVIAPMFTYHDSHRLGTIADWDPESAAWEERIEEAVAETFKDTWLAPTLKLYDNRTNWSLQTGSKAEFWTHLMPHSPPWESEGHPPGAVEPKIIETRRELPRVYTGDVVRDAWIEQDEEDGPLIHWPPFTVVGAAFSINSPIRGGEGVEFSAMIPSEYLVEAGGVYTLPSSEDMSGEPWTKFFVFAYGTRPPPNDPLVGTGYPTLKGNWKPDDFTPGLPDDFIFWTLPQSETGDPPLFVDDPALEDLSSFFFVVPDESLPATSEVRGTFTLGETFHRDASTEVHLAIFLELFGIQPTYNEGDWDGYPEAGTGVDGYGGDLLTWALAYTNREAVPPQYPVFVGAEVGAPGYARLGGLA